MTNIEFVAAFIGVCIALLFVYGYTIPGIIAIGGYLSISDKLTQLNKRK